MHQTLGFGRPAAPNASIYVVDRSQVLWPRLEVPRAQKLVEIEDSLFVLGLLDFKRYTMINDSQSRFDAPVYEWNTARFFCSRDR